MAQEQLDGNAPGFELRAQAASLGSDLGPCLSGLLGAVDRFVTDRARSREAEETLTAIRDAGVEVVSS